MILEFGQTREAAMFKVLIEIGRQIALITISVN